MRSWVTTILLAMIPTPVLAGSFLLLEAPAGEPEQVNHPSGYRGAGSPGVLQIYVYLDPGVPAFIPVQNAIGNWSCLNPQSLNLVAGEENNIPPGFFDFESVLLHELGHCLGLGHGNLAEKVTLLFNKRFTRSTEGKDGSYDLDDGDDGVEGSSDDLRGDDENLHWFSIGVNNPFVELPLIDSSTYTRDLSLLPTGDLFAQNAHRSVADLAGFPSTEGVMIQGTSTDEAQRSLGYDDVATLKYAMSGVDEVQDTIDEYTIQLIYTQNRNEADITIEFSDNLMNLAEARIGDVFLLGESHWSYDSCSILFNADELWFMNPVLEDDCGSADIVVTVEAAEDPVDFTIDTGAWIATVTNNGPEPVTNLVVSMTTQGITLASAPCRPALPPSSPLLCSIDSLGSGESEALFIIGTRSSPGIGTANFEVLVQGFEADPDESNNSASASIRFVEGPIEVMVSSPNGGESFQIGGLLPSTWATSNLEGTDLMVLSIKRDSVPPEVTEPDGVNWIVLRQDVLNDGTEEVQIPPSAALGEDWRLFIRHIGTNTFDGSDETVQLVDNPDLLFFDGFEAGDTAEWSSTFPPACPCWNAADLVSVFPDSGGVECWVPSTFFGSGMGIERSLTNDAFDISGPEIGACSVTLAGNGSGSSVTQAEAETCGCLLALHAIQLSISCGPDQIPFSC